MSSPTEKRSVSREPVHLVTTIEVDDKEIGCGVSRDASGSGLLLFTHVEISPGTDVTLSVFFPREEDARRLEASVLRSERIPANERNVWEYRMAVAFRNPPPDLDVLVKSLSKRPPPP
jgi:hypothetical protein